MDSVTLAFDDLKTLIHDKKLDLVSFLSFPVMTFFV